MLKRFVYIYLITMIKHSKNTSIYYHKWLWNLAYYRVQ